MNGAQTISKPDQPEAPPAAADPDRIELANQRVLTYLKALHIPIRQRYGLASQALARAEQDCAKGADPAVAAMANLLEILRETPQGLFSEEMRSVQAVPPINRCGMVPVVMERSGPFTFFFMLFVNTAIRLLKPPVRLYVLLLALAGTAALYFWIYLRN